VPDRAIALAKLQRLAVCQKITDQNMSRLKQIVEAMGQEINRLWAAQHLPGTPPLVPLPSQGSREEGGDLPRGDATISRLQRKPPDGEDAEHLADRRQGD